MDGGRVVIKWSMENGQVWFGLVGTMCLIVVVGEVRK